MKQTGEQVSIKPLTNLPFTEMDWQRGAEFPNAADRFAPPTKRPRSSFLSDKIFYISNILLLLLQKYKMNDLQHHS